MSNTNHPHHGKNFKRMREILGVKQETVALELGEDWDQKKVSRLEEKETIPDDLMDQIAKILNVPADAIKNFDEEKVVNIITNTFHDNSTNQGFNNHCTLNFNPIEKLVEVYDALLKEKDEKAALLERLLNEKK
ncbi:Helix-turn-helix domain-containing protein [Filimonas lacunae]|uniref:Helix-turn-helix domain-containing protein n=1 Tax=Filimonas lacunae TaxID=477680 RepID=A0A1N7RG12_9BACT|nr:helix-turn-helix transcriptional regulator [Filimonas lacunae]SIT34035.1 Helix-turn-helix domain-containing protein [Filimonas lacunae]